MPPEAAPAAASPRSSSGRSDPILIAGGGIGGLAAALALARLGLASHVLESRADLDDEGAGIQVGPNGTRILAALDVADIIRPLAGAPDAIRVLDGASARLLAELPLGAAIAARHGAPYWVAHRSDLHAALLSRATAEPLIEISTGITVVRGTTDQHGVRADAESGLSYRGRALIAADGIWSRVRATSFDPTPPSFALRSAARTVIPRDRAPPGLDANATFAWLAPGAHFVHYPVRAGREIAVVVIVADATASRDWGAAALPDWVAERTAGFHASLRGLIGAAASWRKWSLHTLPAPTRVAAGPVALLGDAAHPVLPFLAQGAVMALEDAIVIAREAAATPDDMRAAFARYERARLPRVARVAAASRRNGEIYHLGGALAAARNGAMRALGGRRIIAGYDWLYGWRADEH